MAKDSLIDSSPGYERRPLHNPVRFDLRWTCFPRASRSHSVEQNQTFWRFLEQGIRIHPIRAGWQPPMFSADDRVFDRAVHGFDRLRRGGFRSLSGIEGLGLVRT